MLASVEVLPADEFDAWLAERERAAGRRHVAARRGAVGRRRARSATASTARASTGRGSRAPELVEDPEAVEKLLREGRGAMPPVGRDWDDTEMDALTDYLEQNLGG